AVCTPAMPVWAAAVSASARTSARRPLTRLTAESIAAICACAAAVSASTWIHTCWPEPRASAWSSGRARAVSADTWTLRSVRRDGAPRKRLELVAGAGQCRRHPDAEVFQATLDPGVDLRADLPAHRRRLRDQSPRERLDEPGCVRDNRADVLTGLEFCHGDLP